MTQDTVFGELNAPLSQNLYAYCWNNPVLYIDPSGHIVICAAAPAAPYIAAGAAALGTAAVTATVKLVDEIDRFFAEDNEEKNLTDKPGKIANKLGKSTAEVKKAIEKVKQDGTWRSGTKNRNPDVVVDTETGEVYPKTPSGGIGDSIGNILDFLD